MAWTTPKTWSAAVLTSSDMNTHVRDNLSYLYGQIPQAYAADGRITLTTGSPFATDVSDAGTIYYTPAIGDRIALYDGSSKWTTFTFTELSVVTSALVASRPHDIFIYNNAGTPAIAALAWTNNTTRSTAVTYQNGILVRSGATNQRLVGTVWVDSGKKVQDLAAFRYVSNLYNAVPKALYVSEATSHNYNGAYRLWNNSNTDNQINWVTCHPSGAFYILFVKAIIKAGADASSAKVWIYLDATGTSPAIANSNFNNQFLTASNSMPVSGATGFHYANLYEFGDHASSTFDSMTLGAWGEF